MSQVESESLVVANPPGDRSAFHRRTVGKCREQARGACDPPHRGEPEVPGRQPDSRRIRSAGAPSIIPANPPACAWCAGDRPVRSGRHRLPSLDSPDVPGPGTGPAVFSPSWLIATHAFSVNLSLSARQSLPRASKKGFYVPGLEAILKQGMRSF